MLRDTLSEALSRLADTPVLWIAGLYLGGLFALGILSEADGNTVLGARILFFGLCGLPFFLGGTYGAVMSPETGIRGYIRAGSTYFFRILLAGTFIIAAAILTIFLLMVPFTLLGGSPVTFLPAAILGVGVPFAFFTFFFDTAVVFEDRKVLDSIRRSVEFVTGGPGRAVSFYLVNLAVGILALFFAVFFWSVIIAERLRPLAEANLTIVQNMTAPQLVDLVGVPGIVAGTAIGFCAVTLGMTLLLTFKACFFRRAAAASPAAPPVGEYDEKGRWYRY